MRALFAGLPAAALRVACTSTAPCRHTLEHVERLEGTVDGPVVLAGIVRRSRQPMAVRAAAARSLATLARTDHDVPALLLDALEEAGDPALERAVADHLVATLSETSTEDGQRGPESIVAKDRAIDLAPGLDPASRARLATAVAGWYEPPLAERLHVGRHGIEAAIDAFGRPVADALIDRIDARSPSETIGLAVEAIRARDEPALRRRAAERLVAVEAERQRPSFAAWLREQVSELVRTRGSGPPSEERLDAMVAVNRLRFVRDTIATMGLPCDQEPVGSRLRALATAPGIDEELRRAALEALEGCEGSR
jgi:hypothetical protein